MFGTCCSTSTWRKGLQKLGPSSSTHRKKSQPNSFTQKEGSQNSVHSSSTQRKGYQPIFSTRRVGQQRLGPSSSAQRKGYQPKSSIQKVGYQVLRPHSMSNLATVVSAPTTKTTKKPSIRNKEDSCASKPPEDVFTSEDTSQSLSSTSQNEETQNPLKAVSLIPTSTSSSFPYLKVSSLTPEQQEGLDIRLCVESEDIVCKFWRLHSRVYESLHEQSVPVDRVVAHLLSLHAFDTLHKGSQKPVLQTFFQELQNAGSVEKVLFIIREYFSFFNYHVIEHIVDGLGTDQDRVELKNYKKEFDEYSKRRIYECPPVYGPMSNADHAKLVLKLDSVYEKYTVKELKKFEYRLSRIFCVTPQSVLRLCRVEEGCLQLIFQVPSFVQQEIFPLSSEQESTLAAEGVIRLTCEDYQFTAKVCGYLFVSGSASFLHSSISIHTIE